MHVVRGAIEGKRFKMGLGAIGMCMTLLGLSFQPVAAQVIQPTGQTNPVTQNPQVLAPQALSASSIPLQGNKNNTQQVLGASSNQFGSTSLLVVSDSSAVASALPAENDPNKLPTSPSDVNKFTLNKYVVPIVAGITLLLGTIALSLAIKNKKANLN